MFRLICFVVGLLCANTALSAIVVGNTHGSITLVEVYDYQCRVCHQEYPVIQQLIRENRDLNGHSAPMSK